VADECPDVSYFTTQYEYGRRQQRLATGLDKLTLADLLRQSAYSRLARDEDLNEAEPSADPTF
jgi:hypothetical protein